MNALDNQININNKAKKIQLEIMETVHSFCEEHGIVYYIIGGTALGAIRHKGFIPWDVDIDIAMPRRDYNLFVEKYSKHLPDVYVCKSYHNDKTHKSPHALVAKKNTNIVFNFDQFNYDTSKREVYIDIMPLDFTPNAKWKKVFQEELITIIKKCRNLKRGKVYSSDNIFRRILKKLGSCPFYFLSWQMINKCQDKVMSMFSNQDNGTLCSMASHFSYKKQSFDKDVYGKPVLYPFENCFFYGPEKIEYYLTRLYGNFLELPSEEVQLKSYKFIKDVTE